MKKLYILIFLTVAVLFTFCTKTIKDNSKYASLENSINDIRQKYVPDRRVNVFDITVADNDGKPILKGYTSCDSAYYALISQAKEINSNFIDSIILLPDKELNEEVYGVINLSVADIRVDEKFSSEMATQALLGTPIRLLQKSGWYRIQTPDKYIGWAQLSTFQPMTKDELNAWNTTDKVIFTDYFGFAYSKPDKNSQTVSDLVNGNMLKLEGEDGSFYKVSYPDKRIAYILKSQSQPYEKWLSTIELTGESLVKKAFTLMGIPYVWGGTSVKGLDCSGLTKTVLFMHGIILTRDASQQAYTGIQVDISNGYDNLQTGDLMYFGKKGEEGKKDRVRHVGFYIGNKEFIHASGCVRIGSLDPEKENYDELNTTEFIRASRIVSAVNTEGIWSLDKNPMYNTID